MRGGDTATTRSLWWGHNGCVRVIDGHLHLWDPALLNYEWLGGHLLQRFGAEELQHAVVDSPADDLEFVFVQAECAPEQTIAEVDWIASLTTRIPVRGIVARAPLEDLVATRQLLVLLEERPLVIGVRRLLQSDPEGFSDRPDFRDAARAVAVAGYTFDACVRRDQLREVARLADALPELTIVLDHLGNPDLTLTGAPVARTTWAADMRRLALRPNVMCKLSGQASALQNDEAVARLHQHFDEALDAFGPDRLLFGSDWPVSLPFGQWLQEVAMWLSDRLGVVGRDRVLAENAERIYRLKPVLRDAAQVITQRDAGGVGPTTRVLPN